MRLSGSGAVRNPVTALVLLFAAWKTFLLAIALGSCAGVAYDTSADLALGLGHSWTPTLVTRLSSWDAVYFTQIARRGYQFEQEWAFGSGLPLVVYFFVRALRSLGIENDDFLGPAAVGVLVANTSHLLSAFVLYRLAHQVFDDARLALVAASLHVLSPAGLFLSAPCAESTFALLNFTGYLLFAEGFRASRQPACRDALVLLAGVCFGLATVFRSNGILSGVLFAWHVVPQLARVPRQPLDAVRRLFILGIAGLCVAAGSIIPQFVAYRRFCTDVEGAAGLRPWCQDYLPSIYTFVQQQYWNVGLFNYWTLSNLPLFLLAGPMLVLLTVSGLEQLVPSGAASAAKGLALAALTPPAAASQVLLAFMAITTYHVQIITRLSSGYPLLYMWLARRLLGKETSHWGDAVVRFMVIYASIQGVLFASFLPPA